MVQAAKRESRPPVERPSSARDSQTQPPVRPGWGGLEWFMPSTKPLCASLPWLAVFTVFGGLPAQAQDRGLASPFGWPRSPALEASQTRAGWDPSFSWGPVRVMPSLQVGQGGFWGGDVSVASANSWFGGVRLGHTPAQHDEAVVSSASEAVMLSGGYRWAGQHSLSLQLVRDRRDSLGLAVRYEWPSYYLRVGLDNKTRLVPQDTLRVSAGVRF